MITTVTAQGDVVGLQTINVPGDFRDRLVPFSPSCHTAAFRYFYARKAVIDADDFRSQVNSSFTALR